MCKVVGHITLYPEIVVVTHYVWETSNYEALVQVCQASDGDNPHVVLHISRSSSDSEHFEEIVVI